MKCSKDMCLICGNLHGKPLPCSHFCQKHQIPNEKICAYCECVIQEDTLTCYTCGRPYEVKEMNYEEFTTIVAQFEIITAYVNDPDNGKTMIGLNKELKAHSFRFTKKELEQIRKFKQRSNLK